MFNHVELWPPVIFRRFSNSTQADGENPDLPGSPVMTIESMPLSGTVTTGRGMWGEEDA